jgi:hypothetical protein
MRGFLSESEKGYYDLRVNGRVFATNDWRGGISTANSSVRYKLNGVLCETLILEKTTRKFLREKYFTKDNQIDNESSFEWGYLSALEDNEDKLFTDFQFRLALIDMARYICTKELRDAWDLDIQKFHRERDFFIDKLIEKHSNKKEEFEFEIEMEWNPISKRCDECGNAGKYMETPCDHPNDCKHWSPKLCERGCLILKEV